MSCTVNKAQNILSINDNCSFFQSAVLPAVSPVNLIITHVPFALCPAVALPAIQLAAHLPH